MVLGTRRKKGRLRGAASADRGGMELPVPGADRSRSPSASGKVEQAGPRHGVEGQERAFVCLAIAQTKPESSRAIAAVITVFSFPHARAFDTDGIVRYEARIDSRLEASSAETTRRISAGKRSSSRTTATVLVWDAGPPRIGRRGPEPCQATIREAPSIV